MTIIVTGGAGFIGSNFIINWLTENNESIVNLDLLTYAGNLDNLSKFTNDSRLLFIKGDIGDKNLVSEILKKFKPRAIINFAAESHVDRSITGPEQFIKTNINGTHNLLECSLKYWNKLSFIEKENFRYLQISTDEVFGSLEKDAPGFTENHNFSPNSPYSASKASADHLVRAYNKTFKLPTLTTHCSNNYGPFQHPEKLIPLVINNALEHKSIPIYGDGSNIRDWLYVEDHCHAISTVLSKGFIGQTYNIGGLNEKSNNEIVHLICDMLDEIKPISNTRNTEKYSHFITYVDDRPGHDKKYSINPTKIESHLNWKPKETFETGILKTLKWYLDNLDWVKKIKKNKF